MSARVNALTWSKQFKLSGQSFKILFFAMTRHFSEKCTVYILQTGLHTVTGLCWYKIQTYNRARTHTQTRKHTLNTGSVCLSYLSIKSNNRRSLLRTRECPIHLLSADVCFSISTALLRRNRGREGRVDKSWRVGEVLPDRWSHWTWNRTSADTPVTSLLPLCTSPPAAKMSRVFPPFSGVAIPDPSLPEGLLWSAESGENSTCLVEPGLCRWESKSVLTRGKGRGREEGAYSPLFIFCCYSRDTDPDRDAGCMGG